MGGRAKPGGKCLAEVAGDTSCYGWVVVEGNILDRRVVSESCDERLHASIGRVVCAQNQCLKVPMSTDCSCTRKVEAASVRVKHGCNAMSTWADISKVYENM